MSLESTDNNNQEEHAPWRSETLDKLVAESASSSEVPLEEVIDRIRDARKTGDVENLAPHLAKTLGKKKVTFIKEVTEGFVAKSGLFEIDGKTMFSKYSKASTAKEMLQSEAAALQRIAATKTLRTPVVIGCYDDVIDPTGHFMLLEPILGMKEIEHWKELGTQLGQLHSDNIRKIKMREKSSSIHVQPDKIEAITEFGLGMGAFHGVCKVTNGWFKTWEECFVSGVIEPMASALEKNGDFGEILEKWQMVREKLGMFFVDRKFYPTLIHGDFHSKNVCEDEQGLIAWDTVGYYGNSEMDLMMPRLERFYMPDKKSFPVEFWQGYRAEMPEQPGEEDRMKLHVIYLQFMTCAHMIRPADVQVPFEIVMPMSAAKERLVKSLDSVLQTVEQKK